VLEGLPLCFCFLIADVAKSTSTPASANKEQLEQSNHQPLRGLCFLMKRTYIFQLPTKDGVLIVGFLSDAE
jgi:hypothetical protein